MAFGAERGTILRSVLGRASKVACLGIVIGVALSVVLARLVESMLVGVRPTNPVSLVLVSTLLLMMALGAALDPGRSATRGEPNGGVTAGVMAERSGRVTQGG
jgi:predicted lysophospholipase L1 biosynthesis ABC-type transport system permease subunit